MGIVGIAIIISLSLGLVGIILMAVIGSNELAKAAARRKGIIKFTRKIYDWRLHEWNYNSPVIVVVEEKERVADQSKIKILHIDHKFARDSRTHREITTWVENTLGEYYDTDRVTWDNPETPENETAKIIKTDMKDLIKHIEEENIKNM